MKNYKVQLIFNYNKKNQEQRTLLVKQVKDDIQALTIAKAYLGNIEYSSILIAESNPAMEKCITEVI